MEEGCDPGFKSQNFQTFFYFFSFKMTLFSKLDFNLPIETANSEFLKNIFCATETNVQGGFIFSPNPFDSTGSTCKGTKCLT